MELRPELRAVVDALLASVARGGEVSLDVLGAAIGMRAVGTEEIDAMMEALESRGRKIAAPEGARGVVHLRAVLDAARVLRLELGRVPTADEIAARAGIETADVRHALELAKVMQR
jgi:hypothetical protein